MLPTPDVLQLIYQGAAFPGAIDRLSFIDYGVHDRDDAGIQKPFNHREWVIIKTTQQANADPNAAAEGEATETIDKTIVEAEIQQAKPAEPVRKRRNSAFKQQGNAEVQRRNGISHVGGSSQIPSNLEDQRGSLVLTAVAAGRVMLTLQYCHPQEVGNCTTNETIDVHVLVN